MYYLATISPNFLIFNDININLFFQILFKIQKLNFYKNKILNLRGKTKFYYFIINNNYFFSFSTTIYNLKDCLDNLIKQD